MQVLLSFTSVDENYRVTMHFIDLPEQVQKEIVLSLSLSGNDEFVLSHGRIVNFDNHHKEILEKTFNGNTNFQRLTLNDLVLLCAVFHNLNLKQRMLPIAQFTIDNHKISFEDLKERAKDHKYRMTIFAK